MPDNIRYLPKCNIFDYEDDEHTILVNPVNKVGVMGNGLALEFKKRYPEVYESYRIHCQTMANGHVDWWCQLVHARQFLAIANLATKDHWRDKSTLDNITLGIHSLVIQASGLIDQIWPRASILVPKLGCGLGGLSWKEVEPVIVDAIINSIPSKQITWYLLGEKVDKQML